MEWMTRQVEEVKGNGVEKVEGRFCQGGIIARRKMEACVKVN